MFFFFFRFPEAVYFGYMSQYRRLLQLHFLEKDLRTDTDIYGHLR